MDVVRRYVVIFFFQAEDGIRVSVASRGLGDVYKRQCKNLGRDGRVLAIATEVLTRRFLGWGTRYG